MDGKNKVAFVTGGGTGIGQGISIELAKAGYDVAFSYCGSVEGAKKTEAEIRKYSVEALAIKADIAASPFRVRRSVRRQSYLRFPPG